MEPNHLSSKEQFLRNPKRRKLITLTDKDGCSHDDQIVFDVEEIGKWIQSNSTKKKKHFLDALEKKEQQHSLNTGISTEKRELSHRINESRVKNERKFTNNPHVVGGAFILDEPEFRDLSISFAIHLYVNYFTLNDLKCPYPYCRRTSTFLSSIDSETLPHDLVELICEHSEHLQCNPPTFYEGALIVEIHDHRNSEHFPTQRRVLLKPDSCLLLNDVHEITSTFNLSHDDQIFLEQKLLTLLSYEPGSCLGTVCLDPSPAVAYAANQLHFQKNKWTILNKKKAIKRSYYDVNSGSPTPVKSAEPSRFRLLQYLHQKSQQENHQTGEESREYSFAMEVHKLLNQTINDQLFPASREKDKNKVPEHSSNPTELINQIVENILQQSPSPTAEPSAAPPMLTPFNRKLKFHISGGKNFCVIQVHSKRGAGYEALMRVGKLPDTNSNGDIVRFPIGNAAAAETLVTQMKALYEREGFGVLIYDSKNDPVPSSQPTQPTQPTQMPPAYGYPQNPYTAAQPQQNPQPPSQSAPTNPTTVPTMMQNQPQPLTSFVQPAAAANNPAFVQLQGSSTLGYNVASNVGINMPNMGGMNANPNMAHAPFQIIGGTPSAASAFNQLALAQKFGGAYVSQLKGRTGKGLVNLPPGATPPNISQHQLSIGGVGMPHGANQMLVNSNSPSGFPVQPNSGTGNVLLRLSNPNQPTQNTPQQSAK